MYTYIYIYIYTYIYIRIYTKKPQKDWVQPRRSSLLVPNVNAQQSTRKSMRLI